MRYALIPHVITTIVTIFTYRWLIEFLPFVYEQRTYIFPLISLLWFITFYKGIQWLGNRLDRLDDQIIANRK